MISTENLEGTESLVSRSALKHEHRRNDPVPSSEPTETSENVTEKNAPSLKAAAPQAQKIPRISAQTDRIVILVCVSLIEKERRRNERGGVSTETAAVEAVADLTPKRPESLPAAF